MNTTMNSTRIPLADITRAMNNPVMDYLPQTPFPTSNMTPTMIRPHNSAAEAIQNASTPLYALRRMSSYGADIAPAVSSLFDILPVALAWYMDNNAPQNRWRQRMEYEVLRNIAHDYLM